MSQLSIRVIRNEADWQQVVAIREQVFVIEQNCPPELEWDEYDATSTHYLAFVENDEVGTARIRESTVQGEVVAKLERFAILQQFRGHGHGKALVQLILQAAVTSGYSTAFIHAQSHLEKMYAGLGFARRGEEFDEAGIPHVGMIYEVENG